MIVSDDGVGMSIKDFCEQFMSLGGSSKFGDGSRFGRIGIGSLALLQYAEAATIETKCAGSKTATRARIQHPWTLDREHRRARLNEMAAGVAEECVHEGSPADHFTRITLENVNPDVWEIGQDPTAFYRLVENLRRILPLRWTDGRLADALATVSPELVGVLRGAHRATGRARSMSTAVGSAMSSSGGGPSVTTGPASRIGMGRRCRL